MMRAWVELSAFFQVPGFFAGQWFLFGKCGILMTLEVDPALALLATARCVEAH